MFGKLIIVLVLAALAVGLAARSSHGAGPERIYMVSDLGASFGSTGFSFPKSKSRANLKAYRHSRFIRRSTPEYVDFNVPTRSAIVYFFL